MEEIEEEMDPEKEEVEGEIKEQQEQHQGEVNEESLSDASLIEEEEEEDQDGDGDEAVVPGEDEDEGSSNVSSVIDLPGEPVTAPIMMENSSNEEGNEELGREEEEEEEGEEMEIEEEEEEEDPLDGSQSPRFEGWRNEEVKEAKEKARQMEGVWKEEEGGREIGIDDEEMPRYVLLKEKEAEKAKMALGMKRTQQGHPPPAKMSRMSTGTTPNATSSALSTPSPGSVATRREGREWRPSVWLYKPLDNGKKGGNLLKEGKNLTKLLIFSGWVREVIYKQLSDGSYDLNSQPKIVYHAPVMPGTKPRSFNNLQEMTGYRKCFTQIISVGHKRSNCLSSSSFHKGLHLLHAQLLVQAGGDARGAKSGEGQGRERSD